jgi:hypothetical protein
MSLSRGPKVVSNGLVLYLDAANNKSYPGTSTTWTDLSGNGYNGTLTNGPTFSSANGGSIVFDGVDDYISIVSNANLTFGTGNFSIGFWIYRASSWSTTCNFTDGNSGALDIYTSGGNLRIAPQYASSVAIASVSSLSTNLWYNLTIVKSSSVTTAYINGTSIGSTSDTSNYSSSILKFGGTLDGYFTGRMSNILIYNRSLSATEVLQNYNATKSRFGL